MQKTCFVIMGYGIKQNYNLDLTYQDIIKPCIKANGLVPYPLYKDNKYNAYRCDEIIGSSSIDYKFVMCLSHADIVIADISTMNINAIYELGARHALKPNSTILLCAKGKEKEFHFFDLTYVPILFYEHGGLQLNENTVFETQKKLNQLIDFAVHADTNIPDNPIQRALIESKAYSELEIPKEKSIYELYIEAKKDLDDNNLIESEKKFQTLFSENPSEENLLLLVLAKYKKYEKEGNIAGLVDCIQLIQNSFNLSETTSETLLGRFAAICLRIFSFTGDDDYYYMSLENYGRGAAYSYMNLYCPRNYCATLLRVHEITDDLNVIREYYYTAVHYAKFFLHQKALALTSGTYSQRLYYYYNKQDLKAIVDGKYTNIDNILISIDNKDTTLRQKETLKNGIKKLSADLDKMRSLLNLP